ncbi:MAG: TRAP transporter small permease [Defluviicoccus sp.]|nr:TRAP transporter small permease [Defluviicoccus sp.]
MTRILEAVSHLFARLTQWLTVAMAAVMVVCLLLQIFFRYALSSPLTWTEELAVLMFAWVIMLMGSLGVREDFHVRLTLLLDRLPESPRLWVERATLAAILVFGVLLAVAGYDYVEGTLGVVSAAIGFPIEALHLAAPVCGVLIVLHAAARLLGGGRPA